MKYIYKNRNGRYMVSSVKIGDLQCKQRRLEYVSEYKGTLPVQNTSIEKDDTIEKHGNE